MFRRFIAALPLIFLSSAASADDWLLEKGRGAIEIQSGDSWVRVGRGAQIPDGTLIRTGMFGQAHLVRGKESLDLGPMTIIVIHDKDGQQYTTVVQMVGDVAVEAEARNVEHFAVETPYLAAVVKGTRFTVSVREGQSSVSVSRGRVTVGDRNGGVVAVTAGQSVSVTREGDVNVSGKAVPTTGDDVAPVLIVDEAKLADAADEGRQSEDGYSAPGTGLTGAQAQFRTSETSEARATAGSNGEASDHSDNGQHNGEDDEDKGSSNGNGYAYGQSNGNSEANPGRSQGSSGNGESHSDKKSDESSKSGGKSRGKSD